MKKTFNVLCFMVFGLLITSGLFTQPQYYNYNATGTNNAFPLNINTSTGKTTQHLYLPGAFNNPTPAPSGNITKVWFFAATSGNATYTTLTIKMAQTTDVDLPTGAWFTTGMTTVFDQTSFNLTSTAGQFFSITLTTPFAYNPALSLVIEVTQCGYSGTGIGLCYSSLVSGIKRSAGPLSVLPCPHPWGNQNNYSHNTGIDVAPGTLPNRTLLLPTPGVNTNYVGIPHQAGMIGFANMTIEAWVKIGSSTAPNTVLNKGGSSFDYQLGINSGGIPFFRAVGTVATSTGLIITQGVWTHLAVTKDASNVRFYKDGALASTVPFTTAPGSSTNEMRIGRGGSDPGSGNLEEVRLWTVARTQGAIDSNRCRKYPSSFNSSTGLLALWHFDSTYTDSVSGFNGTPTTPSVGFDTVSYPIPGVNCNLVGIHQIGNITPKAYTLEQNYPNPFNPATNIKFSIPKDGFVEILIYDILGKEVAVLVQDPFQAGTYNVDFNAGNLSSGVYFYTIKVNDFTATKKMLLIK